MTIQVGDRLPAVNLKQLTADGIKDVPITELTKGKKVVLFAVPGAFTHPARRSTFRASSSRPKPSKPKAWTRSCASPSTTPSS